MNTYFTVDHAIIKFLTCSVSRPFSSVGFPSVMRMIRGQSFLPLTFTTPPAVDINHRQKCRTSEPAKSMLCGKLIAQAKSKTTKKTYGK